MYSLHTYLVMRNLFLSHRNKIPATIITTYLVHPDSEKEHCCRPLLWYSVLA